MFDMIKTATLSAFIGLGTLAAIPATAHADSIYLGFGNNDDSRVGVYAGDDGNRDWSDGRRERRDRDRRHDRDRDWRRSSCSPDRALDKADRMGLDRARIVDVDRYTVKVSGRKFGNRITVVFANERGCPIMYR
jgi:hypothetical protein